MKFLVGYGLDHMTLLRSHTTYSYSYAAAPKIKRVISSITVFGHEGGILDKSSLCETFVYSSKHQMFPINQVYPPLFNYDLTTNIRIILILHINKCIGFFPVIIMFQGTGPQVIGNCF